MTIFSHLREIKQRKRTKEKHPSTSVLQSSPIDCAWSLFARTENFGLGFWVPHVQSMLIFSIFHFSWSFLVFSYFFIAYLCKFFSWKTILYDNENE